jgi:branched-chain amino acid transport system substrate-binding protein
MKSFRRARLFWILILFLPGKLLAEDIVIGMSAAFTGPSRALGIELYRGSMAYLEPVNRRGGIHGKKIAIRAYDDGYNPTPAIRNTIKLIDDDDVFLLVNYVGTPTVTRVLPLLKNYRKKHVYLFFPFTGAEPQRQPPYSDFVFNLRASYQNETAGLVDHFVRLGRTKIAVFYQADAYGRAGWQGVRDALARHGLTINREATYRRGTEFSASLKQQLEILSRFLCRMRGFDQRRARFRLASSYRQRVVRRQRADGGPSFATRQGQGCRLHEQSHQFASRSFL